MTECELYLKRKKVEYGDKFDPSDLALHFAPYLHSNTRIKVQHKGEDKVEHGRVGITTGWKPHFLLLYRVDSIGSSRLLYPEDKLLAIKRPGMRKYEEVKS